MYSHFLIFYKLYKFSSSEHSGCINSPRKMFIFNRFLLLEIGHVIFAIKKKSSEYGVSIAFKIQGARWGVGMEFRHGPNNTKANCDKFLL